MAAPDSPDTPAPGAKDISEARQRDRDLRLLTPEWGTQRSWRQWRRGLWLGVYTGSFGAGGSNTVAIADNPTYIDSAIIRSRIRLRYDSAYELNSPDKAEFFYAKCGCYANIKKF